MIDLKKIFAAIALLLTIANARCEVGLIAHYPFNGNANDVSGNGNNGFVNNAILSADRFGSNNCAYQFNGTTAAILVSDNAALQSLTSNYTFLVWAKFASLPSRDISLLFKSPGVGAQNNKWILWRHYPVGIGVLSGAAPEGNWNYNYPFATNRWYLIGFSAAETNVSISVNGVTYSVQDADPSLRDTTGATLYIGGAEPGGNQWFKGSLDDVRIYNRPLTSSEIEQIYSTEAPPISFLPLTVRKAVYFDSSLLQVGANYQVQVSTNLSGWTNFGSPFTATNAYWRSTSYWDVEDWDKLFFRVQTVP